MNSASIVLCFARRIWMAFCIVIGLYTKAAIRSSIRILKSSFLTELQRCNSLSYLWSAWKTNFGKKPRKPTSVIVAVAISNLSSGIAGINPNWKAKGHLSYSSKQLSRVFVEEQELVLLVLTWLLSCCLFFGKAIVKMQQLVLLVVQHLLRL